ncbi:MAG: 7-carboxy-7-deazaguanine synthase QueE [Rickettsiales bacterium]|jgi:organic radical activating enzyme|nr:7-carboxy-7-deazaguanine synthase QueE [Rickettsiales bacterium]
MFGKNPKRKALMGDGQILEVQEIFPTFQGEGPYAGWPAVFIRLGGCNLACDFCDTEFESFKEQSLASVLQTVQKLAKNPDGQRVRTLIVITGGEPFRQPISPLCDALLDAGFMVQIETNGTLYRPLDERINIVCSPKNTGNYAPIREDLLARVSALKFIVSTSKAEYRHVPDVGQGQYNIPVYVQPMDEYDPVKNKANLEYAVRLVEQCGYRLSLQLHKIAGVP